MDRPCQHFFLGPLLSLDQDGEVIQGHPLGMGQDSLEPGRAGQEVEKDVPLALDGRAPVGLLFCGRVVYEERLLGKKVGRRIILAVCHSLLPDQEEYMGMAGQGKLQYAQEQEMAVHSLDPMVCGPVKGEGRLGLWQKRGQRLPCGVLLRKAPVRREVLVHQQDIPMVVQQTDAQREIGDRGQQKLLGGHKAAVVIPRCFDHLDDMGDIIAGDLIPDLSGKVEEDAQLIDRRDVDDPVPDIDDIAHMVRDQLRLPHGDGVADRKVDPLGIAGIGDERILGDPEALELLDDAQGRVQGVIDHIHLFAGRDLDDLV